MMTTLGEIRGAARRVQRCREVALRTLDGWSAPRGERARLSVEDQIVALRKWSWMIEELSAKVNERIHSLEAER